MNPSPYSLAYLLRLVADLCRLRRGPQDAPYSPALLVGLIVASVVLDLLLASLLGIESDVIARSVLSVVVILGLAWTALSMRKLEARFVQLATALVACAMFFSLLMLPVALLVGTPPESAQLTPTQVLLAWVALAIMGWKLVVDAHIVRQALEAPFGLALMLVFAWALADWALGRVVFGGA